VRFALYFRWTGHGWGKRIIVNTSRQEIKKEKRPTRILVADDHCAVLESLVPILESQFTVVGTASDGKAAVEAEEKLHPDVVVLDISMPVMSGIDAARQMRRSGSKAPIVFLTVHQDVDILAAAKRAGGLGYVVKNRLKTDLVLAITEALEGRGFVSPFQL
jgi:DNA-binding NarL/FixJ family response regulator